MKSSLRVAQLSDIHFYETSDGEPGRYRHSINCLKKIQLAFEEKVPDLLVVSGDITNIGDKLSLERIYQWINDKIYVDGDYYGLECAERKIPVVAVPGNHDAFNAPSHGSNYKRWQSSLVNFYSVFHDHIFPSREGVDYSWHSRGETKVFVCRVDSCYLGDNETDHLPGSLSLDIIAKGNLSKQQSTVILKLYDKGIRGELKDSGGNLIPAGEFLASLKILVMHHYLFEPPDVKAESLLQMADKKAVFQNIAMSDFDVLLCGHKHIADVHQYSYMDHFDPRGKVRLAFNHVRRSLGISSLPLNSPDGKQQSRFVRFVLAFLMLSKTKGGGLTQDHTDEIIEILEKALKHPEVLRKELQRYMRQKNVVAQAGLFDDDEIRELQSRIREKFSSEQRKDLAVAAASLKGVVERLGGRPFVQLIAGSSAKQSETNARARALTFFEIEFDSQRSGTQFTYERHLWSETAEASDGTSGNFTEPLKGEYFFSNDRVGGADESDAQ